LTDKYRLLISAFILLIISMVPVYSQEAEQPEEPKLEKIEYYTLGDQCFSINAGLFIPLFFMDFTPGASSAVSATHLTVGGTGSLAYEAYLSNNLKLGMEVGGMFAKSPNGNNVFMVPITAKFGYEFHFGQFSMPIYLGAGINIISYQDYETNVQFLLKPGISLYWNYNSNWGFGGNLVYWVAPDLVLSNPDESRVGNFLDFTISAQYHF